MRTFSLITLLIVLSACAAGRPSNPSNVCHMFEERRSWYRAAEQTEQRWGLPVHVTMAFIYQESAFNARARPERTRLLWVIPWTRPSTARGYAQALSSTWADYQQETGNHFARRSNFGDAVDFIGWYNHYSPARSNIALTDARNLYLAYHEGHAGITAARIRTKAGCWKRLTLLNVTLSATAGSMHRAGKSWGAAGGSACFKSGVLTHPSPCLLRQTHGNNKLKKHK